MKTTTKNIAFKPTMMYALVLSMLIVAAYFKLFSANFISWDDGDVVLNNKHVHDFDIKAFFTNYYVGNYAPITMIGFAIDWLIFHGHAAGHHSMSLLFHLLNGVLVYKFAELVLKDNLKALICTLIFCFHPLQVETVAWVSAKNNLVYSVFFLLGLIYYSKFIIDGIKKHYFYALLFFILSVLSKPSAICFPLVLPLLDYLLKQKTDLKSIVVNKIPFIIVAVILGVATIYTRTEDKFINQSHAYAIHERIGYAGYAILQYIYKFFIPINLSVIYPYPQDKVVSIIAGYIVIVLLAFGLYKLYKSSSKIIFFGISFFIINLLLVLQFIPFGEVLTADRYMYLPIIGICMALLSIIPLKEKQLKITGIALVLVFGSLTFIRASVWKNSISLYSDIIKKYPHSFVALNSLGAEYMLNKNYDMSLRYLNAAINENTEYYKGYYNRGLLYAQTDRIKNAIRDFDKAIALKQYLKAYVARANAYYLLKDFSKAINDAESALKQDPNNPKANYVLANCYDDLNQLDKSLTYYNKVIASNTENPLYFMRRAIVYGKMQQYQKCLQDLDACTNIDSNYAEAYYWKGVVKVNMNQNPCTDLKRAVDLGFNAAQQPLSAYCR
ncbi:MAG TPA: tetratricopeptide repeat protein [Bacteroidia bacterium]|nr:tetratricopeptide repeat protein [Bacteroidia bacterium]